MGLSNGIGFGTGRHFGGGGAAAIGGLAAPVIAALSAPGATPLILSISDGDYVAGKYLQWQFGTGLAPAKNGDGSFAAPAQSGVAFIDGDTWARLDIALGYNDPPGAFDFICRVLQDNPTGAVTVVDPLGNSFNCDASGWSADYTDTIIGSSAALATATGVNKSQYLNINNGNLSWVHNNAVGVICLVRATIAAQAVKWHAEFKYDGIAASGTWSCGVADSGAVTSFAGFVQPGSSSVPGLTCSMNSAGTQLVIYSNGSSSTPSLPGGTIPAIGDAVILEGDTSANQVKVYYYRQATGISTLLATVTLTGVYIPAAWFVCGGGASGNAVQATSDSGTFNAGGQALLKPLTAGYSIYG